MESKLYIAQYAGITVMLPAAMVVAGWLWCTASRKLALLWLGVLFVAYLVVGFSKVLFKGWGIGLESLDIAVISGHAMNACLVSTVVLSLLLRQLDHRLRWLALGLAGILLSTSIPKYTAEGVLNSLAVTLSGAEKAFMQPHWRTSGGPSRL